jgi:hypothetical protein
MNCTEFERILPDYLDGAYTPERLAHLDSCPSCSSLLSDLNLISARAKLLLASEEPSPAVWNALEARLRSEGLIRRPETHSPAVSFFSRWRTAWLVPVAAALAIAAGLKLYHPAGAGDNVPVAKQASIPAPAVEVPVSREDQQLLNTVASRPLSQRVKYRADLDDANSFIRDAEASIKADPNDIYTRQMLINAYEQKQMLYDLAVDREGGQ